MLDAISPLLCTCLAEDEVELGADSISLKDGAVLICASLESEQVGERAWRAHAHVRATLVGGRGELPLESCVVGVGDSEAAATQDAARNWFGLVWCLIYSLLEQGPQMGTLHFHGDEAWGVRGAHGFVGPVLRRGPVDEHSEDLDQILTLPLFAGVDASLPEAFDGRVHLLKAVARGRPGRLWARDRWDIDIEMDGHDVGVEHKGQRLGLVTQPWVAIRYALCFPNDPAKLRV